MDGLDIGLSDLAEGHGGRDREFSPPTQEDTHLSHRLELGHGKKM
jgi:hypothetical protein